MNIKLFQTAINNLRSINKRSSRNLRWTLKTPGIFQIFVCAARHTMVICTYGRYWISIHTGGGQQISTFCEAVHTVNLYEVQWKQSQLRKYICYVYVWDPSGIHDEYSCQLLAPIYPWAASVKFNERIIMEVGALAHPPTGTSHL